MLILCPHCQEPLRVRTSRQIVNTVRDYYCNCDNEICLSRPVMSMFHKHDIQPPVFKNDEMSIVIQSLQHLPIQKKQILFDFFGHELQQAS